MQYQASDADAIDFAERLLALLDSGSFTGTYKYAVLLALVDCCVERCRADGRPPDVLSARVIADKVLDLYWPQAVPFASAHGVGLLDQMTGGRRDIATRIAEYRRQRNLDAGVAPSAAQRSDPDGFAALADQVYEIVVRMPLPKLQRVGRHTQPFLYRISWPDEVATSRMRRSDFDDNVHLLPGVGGFLLRLAGLIRPIVQREWAAFVARRNRDLLEDAYLDDFLFGVERVSLDRLRSPLCDLQAGTCFYCGDSLTARIEIDHFLPWSKVSDNGIDNLVAAHRRCNSAKRASLAATDHLARWLDRSQDATYALRTLCEDAGWPRDTSRTHSTARALYLWLPEGTPLWRRGDDYEPADGFAIRELLIAADGMQEAAEPGPPSYGS